MLGSRAREFMHPDDQALAVDNWMEMLASPGPGAAYDSATATRTAHGCGSR